MTHDSDNWEKNYSALISAGTARSTCRAYQRDVTYFWAWAKFALKQKEAYPVSEETVIRFVLDHVGNMKPSIDQQLVKEGYKRKLGPLKISSIRRYLISLSVAHQEAGHISPTKSSKVKILLRRAKHASNHQTTNKKAAITRDMLLSMISTCDDSLEGVRDRALLLVAFTSGGRRRDELVNIKVNDLTKVDGGYVLRIRKSKTDQGGKGFEVPVLGDAATALKAWLLMSGIRSGALFRGINRNGSMNDSIYARTINRIVKRRVKMLGFDPDEYGAHSLRSGFITEAARYGANMMDAMALSGHRSVVIASGYYRKAEVLENPAGKLFTDE